MSWKKFEAVKAVKSEIQSQLLTQRIDWDGVMNMHDGTLMWTRTCIYLVLFEMARLFVCEGAIGLKEGQEVMAGHSTKIGLDEVCVMDALPYKNQQCCRQINDSHICAYNGNHETLYASYRNLRRHQARDRTSQTPTPSSQWPRHCRGP